MIPISKIDLMRNARNLDKNLWLVPGLLLVTTVVLGTRVTGVKLIGAVIDKLTNC